MTNKEISVAFSLLADLMKLHGEEDFRIKSYDFASRTLKSVEGDLSKMTLPELKSIKGIGDAIGQRIIELQRSGRMKMMDGYLEKTPPGVVQLLQVKGLGPGKIRTLWLELGIESPGELLYACHENRLTLLKGFGEKTQTQIQQQVEFQLRSADFFRADRLEIIADDLLDDLRAHFNTDNIALTGEMRRALPIVKGMDILVEAEMGMPAPDLSEMGLTFAEHRNGIWYYNTANDVPVRIFPCKKGFYGLALLKTTCDEAFLKELNLDTAAEAYENKSEEEIFESVNLPYILPELRESAEYYWKIKAGKLSEPLLDLGDIRGVIHAHSTYSDGAASLKNMAEASRELGYSYLVITDHSQSAFYANGLRPERVLLQWAEIEELNSQYTDFKIFKGIESDILNDGNLDYSNDLLAGFDVVIASVHSNLRMDEAKATARLIKAIENPYTTILGHPTGRLLLSREGYAINHRKVIDACAANGVAIELNANPNRLDLDWTHIPYALEQGVKIAVNPDAHSTQGIKDIRYGVKVARKGGLTAEQCLNTLSAEAFQQWLGQRKLV